MAGRSSFIFFYIISIVAKPVLSQVTDTIANWDGINVEWTISAGNGEVVINPEQQGINPSAHCMGITSSDNPYDLIYTDFSAPVNFVEFPTYRLKILAQLYIR